MSNMINELADVSHVLIDEKKVHAVIRSLSYYSWDHMKIILTYNEYIKSFEDVR